MHVARLMTSQKIISTKNFQSKFATVTKEADLNEDYYNIVKNGESIGVYLPRKMWEGFLEDLEASHSESFKQKIANSRNEAKSKKLYSLDEAFDI